MTLEDHDACRQWVSSIKKLLANSRSVLLFSGIGKNGNTYKDQPVTLDVESGGTVRIQLRAFARPDHVGNFAMVPELRPIPEEDLGLVVTTVEERKIPDEYDMNAHQAAQQLGKSPDYMRQLVHRGEIRAVKVGKTWHCSGESVREYLGRNGSPARSASR